MYGVIIPDFNIALLNYFVEITKTSEESILT